MYKLRCTIKSPNNRKDEFVSLLRQLGVNDLIIESVEYYQFLNESRIYWDYVFPDMLEDKQPVTYITFDFDDTKEGREFCHRVEWNIGWVPLNIRYVEV